MFESLEDRQFMSATLMTPTTTAGVTDGTSNTVMTAEATVERKAGAPQQDYYAIRLEDVLISSYR